MFLVTVSQSGAQFDRSRPLEAQSGWAQHAAFMDGLVDAGFIVLGGPLPAGRVALAIEAESEQAIRDTLARDPWSQTHLRIEAVEPWTIRLNGTGHAPVVPVAPVAPVGPDGPVEPTPANTAAM
jgi:hypothetical protein